jgi:hypothetical protein
MFARVSHRKIQIDGWCRPRLLDHAVQKDHSLLPVHVKENPGDAIAHKIRPHLVQPAFQRATGWHSDRPAKLDGFDVFPNQFAILGSHCLQQARTGSFPASV